VGGASHLVGEVAEVVLDLAEGLVFGEIDEAFGHSAEGGFGVRAQLRRCDQGFVADALD